MGDGQDLARKQVLSVGVAKGIVKGADVYLDLDVVDDPNASTHGLGALLTSSVIQINCVIALRESWELSGLARRRSPRAQARW